MFQWMVLDMTFVKLSRNESSSSGSDDFGCDNVELMDNKADASKVDLHFLKNYNFNKNNTFCDLKTWWYTCSRKASYYSLVIAANHSHHLGMMVLKSKIL